MLKMADLLKIINKGQDKQIHRNNYRITCKTLCESGHLQRKLTSSLQWVLSLTEKGREKAELIYSERSE